MMPIRWPKATLNLLPRLNAARENTAVTIPIITLGCQIFTSSMARLNPTARASMLVATLKTINVVQRDGYSFELC